MWDKKTLRQNPDIPALCCLFELAVTSKVQSVYDTGSAHTAVHSNTDKALLCFKAPVRTFSRQGGVFQGQLILEVTI